MIDERARDAQALFWKVQKARAEGKGDAPEVVAWLGEMADLYEGRAKDLLGSGDANGWIDLQAAATAAREAGDTARARQIIDRGWDLLWDLSGEARDTIEAQLARLERWLDPTQVKAIARPAPATPILRDLIPLPAGAPRELAAA